MAKSTTTWKIHNQTLVACARCPRLRKHCEIIAHEKRKSFANETYWGKPVPSFGDIKAHLVLIGLAPAAHGANRTGRMFTGDRSGDWLYRALHKAGFANQPTSTHADDGLHLKDAFICASAHCAPPDNKPTPKELTNCSTYLEWELEHLENAHVYMGLGKIGFDYTFNVLKKLGLASGSRPAFSHGAAAQLSSGRWLIGTYHPSQQNTFTGRLTEVMFDSVFTKARSLIDAR